MMVVVVVVSNWGAVVVMLQSPMSKLQAVTLHSGLQNPSPTIALKQKGAHEGSVVFVVVVVVVQSGF